MNCEICDEIFTGMDHLIKHASCDKKRLQPNVRYFSCTPCSMTFHSIDDVIQHSQSKEHSIMALATGIQFDTQAESSDISSAPYPPLYFCILCSSRDDNPFENHLKSATHREIAWLMRDICRKKKVNYINYSSDSLVREKTQEFMNKIINIKYKEFLGDAYASDHSLEFVCDLCNIHFNKHECYKQHRENQTHKRMEKFMMTMSLIVRDLNILGPDRNVSETFSHSLPPLYHCELCCLWIEKSSMYVQHVKGYTHKRIEELFRKLCNKRNGDAINIRLKKRGFPCGPHFKHSTDYCKLCAVWCFDVKKHFVGNNHKHIEHFVNSLLSESDQKFIFVYIDSQAHMKFSNSPPPNYCIMCNILHSKSEKYKMHLEGDEHKRTLIKENIFNYEEKASKKLKTSPTALHLRNAESNIFKNYGLYYSARGKHQGNKHKIRKTSSPKRITRGTREVASPRIDIESRGARNSNTLLDSESFESNSSNSPHPKFNCELCNFSSSNPLQYDKHLMSVKHRKIRKMLNKKETPCADTVVHETSNKLHPLQYNCELCGVFNDNSEEYEFHLNSAKHKKNQWLLYVLMQKPLSI